MKELIGKVNLNKSSLSCKIVTDKTEQMKCFTDIGLKLAKKIPESFQTFESHMKNGSSEIEKKPLSINELKDAFFL